MESVELSWQPVPGERYSVWVRIGGGGCHGRYNTSLYGGTGGSGVVELRWLT